MSYTLRPYQEEAVQAGVDYFLNDRRGKPKMIIAPTGAGKSLVIANIALRLQEPTLCLQPSKELLIQNYEKFISYGYEASIYSASVGVKEIGDVTFATIGSVYRKPELFAKFKYAIIDECHKMNVRDGGMYTDFFNKLNMKICGLTATPFKLKSYMEPEPHSKLNFLNRMRPKMFHDVLHVTQIQEMVENDWWAKLEYVQDNFNDSKLRINSNGSGYTDKSILTVLTDNNTTIRAVRWAKELREEGRKRIIIFMPSISEAENVARRLKVNSISSNTKPKERIEILERFASGEDWAIVNVNVLSIGYDNQKVDGIIDCSPTLSLASYYQKIGRGVRIDMSDNPTKKDCKIVDMAGNFKMFGKVEDLEFIKIKGLWCVVSNDRILTNTPMTKDEPIPELDNEVLWFGKFKGEKFKDIPKWYWKFIEDKFSREDNRNEKLFRYIDKKL